jgi:hypothetical protein
MRTEGIELETPSERYCGNSNCLTTNYLIVYDYYIVNLMSIPWSLRLVIKSQDRAVQEMFLDVAYHLGANIALVFFLFLFCFTDSIDYING